MLDDGGEEHEEAPQLASESDDTEVDELVEDEGHTSTTVDIVTPEVRHQYQATPHSPHSHRNDGPTPASGSSSGSPATSSRRTSSRSSLFAPRTSEPQPSHQETTLHAPATQRMSAGRLSPEDSIRSIILCNTCDVFLLTLFSCSSSSTSNRWERRRSSSTLVGSFRPNSSHQRCDADS